MADRTCSIEGCGNPHEARGWCNKHYLRAKRLGDPLAGGHEQIRGDDLARLLSRVDRDGPLPTWAPFLGPCWIWTGHVNENGYGRIGYKRKVTGTHRLAYELLVGPIPEGMEPDHLCRERACCNPAHLEPVTHDENMRRAAHAWGDLPCAS